MCLSALLFTVVPTDWTVCNFHTSIVLDKVTFGDFMLGQCRSSHMGHYAIYSASVIRRCLPKGKCFSWALRSFQQISSDVVGVASVTYPVRLATALLGPVKPLTDALSEQ